MLKIPDGEWRRYNVIR